MLSSAELRNYLGDEDFALILSYLIYLFYQTTHRARLDAANSKDPDIRQEALDFLTELGIPVEVEKPAKRSHKGLR